MIAFQRPDTELYQIEVTELFKAFFDDPSIQTHVNLLRATYIQKHRNSFWLLYWQHFQQAILDYQKIDEVTDILDMWFDNSDVLRTECAYIVPEFFIELLNVLEEVRSSKLYKRVRIRFRGSITLRDRGMWLLRKHYKSLNGGYWVGLFDR